MKNFYLNFNMNQEDGKTVQFINELEEFEESLIVRTKEGYYYPQIDEPIANIYISSTGGENRMAAIIYHFFNVNKKNKFYSDFTLFLHYYVISQKIFHNCSCNFIIKFHRHDIGHNNIFVLTGCK